VADPPLDERLNGIADAVAETVEDADTAGAIIETLAAAADAYQAGDIESAHEQMHAALEILAALAEAADGDAKQSLEALASELGACMEETAGVLLANHVQSRLG
jgi:glutamate-1-semialdehyde aminotransferase